jgi:hypothetical protein
MAEIATGGKKYKWWLAFPILALLYTVVFFIYTYPLINHFSDGFPGHDTGFSDANQYIWNVYNLKKALHEGSNPLYTDLLLYPKGASLLFHTYTPIMGLIGMLFSNDIVAVNAVLLLSFVLSAIGAFYLSRKLVPNNLLALTTGLIFAFSPYKMAHLLEHYHLMLTATIPFFVLSFLKAFRFEPGRWHLQILNWKYVLLCFLLGIVAFLSDYYTVFFMLYFSAAYALYFWLNIGGINWRKPKPWLITVAVFVASGVLVNLLKKWGVDNKGGLWWGGDVAGYLLAPDNNRWLSTSATEKIYATEKIFNNPSSVENVVFLGYSLLLLTVLAFFWRRKFGAEAYIKQFIFLAVLFWFITMPEMSVFGKILFRNPTAMLHFVPFFNNIRCPTRAVVMLTLFQPIVCFYFLNLWLVRKPALANVIPLVLLLVVFLEFQPKDYPLISKNNMPEAYKEVAKAKGEVLFVFPFGMRDGFQEKGQMVLNDLFYQTQHHKKMPGAYISRINPQEFDDFDKDPVMHAFVQMETDSTFLPQMPTVSERENFLKLYKPDIFLVTPRMRNPHIHTYLQQLLLPEFGTRNVGKFVLWERR